MFVRTLDSRCYIVVEVTVIVVVNEKVVSTFVWQVRQRCDDLDVFEALDVVALASSGVLAVLLSNIDCFLWSGAPLHVGS